MAAVNRSMFEAGVIAEAPSMVEGGASLMVLPLNLVALIVTYVNAFILCFFSFLFFFYNEK